MSENNGPTPAREKVAKIKKQPEREHVLQPTFAAARHNTGGREGNEHRPPGSRLLQRQCSCGKHTIGGEECDECRQKQEISLQRAAIKPIPDPPRVPLPPKPPPIPASSAPRDFSRIPPPTLPPRPKLIIQPKLSVNTSGDQYEQEAAPVADTELTREVTSPQPLEVSWPKISGVVDPVIQRDRESGLPKGAIPSSKLDEWGTPEQMEFMRTVYDTQLKEKAQKKEFFPGVNRKDLERVEGKHELHKDAAQDCKVLYGKNPGYTNGWGRISPASSSFPPRSGIGITRPALLMQQVI